MSSLAVSLWWKEDLYSHINRPKKKRNDPNCCKVLIIILIVTICRYPRERATTGIAAKLAQLIGHEKNHIFAIFIPVLTTLCLPGFKVLALFATF